MKVLQFVVSMAALLSIPSAFANSDLADDMKQMSAALKTITAQVSIAASNASSASLCDQITAGIEDAKQETPDSVDALPAANQPAQQTAFVGLLNQLEAQVAKLKADFVANNNQQAAVDLNAINATKKTGHDQFKNN